MHKDLHLQTVPLTQPTSEGKQTMRKDVEKLIRKLRKVAGVELNYCTDRHCRVSLNGAFVVMIASTPSDRRAINRIRAALRRAGIFVI